MARVLLEGNLDHLVTPTHSDARGPVVRGASIEVMKMHWRAGDSARPHQHAEEQAIYVISGRMRMTCGGETYEIGPGEVSYHPSNVLHSAMAVEDTVAISFKNIVAPFYEATTTLLIEQMPANCETEASSKQIRPLATSRCSSRPCRW